MTDLEPLYGLFTDIGDAIPSEPSWVIPNVLPVGLSFIGGPGKFAQKSSLALGLAALVSGRHCPILPPWGTQVPEPGRVVIFSAEADAGVLRHMMEEGLSTPTENDKSILVADDPWAWRLDDADALIRLETWLKHLEPKLVILDPLVEFHSLEEKDARDMTRLLRGPRKWAYEHDASFLVVHHTNKPQGPDKATATYDPMSLRGSGAFLAKLDGCIMVTPQPKGVKLLNTIFKRGLGWERQVRFGCYGEIAEEILTEQDRAVLALLKAGAPDALAIAAQLHLEAIQVKDSVEKLIRNEMWAVSGTNKRKAGKRK